MAKVIMGLLDNGDFHQVLQRLDDSECPVLQHAVSFQLRGLEGFSQPVAGSWHGEEPH